MVNVSELKKESEMTSTTGGCNELYVMGCADLSPYQFLCIIQKYGINCVVDIRSYSEQDSLTGEHLQKVVSEHGGYYLSFVQEFGGLPKCTLHRDLQADSIQTLNSKSFLQGIARLQQGLQRGFRIVMIDGVTYASDSYRLLLVSQCLVGNSVKINNIIAQADPIRCIVLGDPIITESKSSTGTPAVPSRMEMGHWGEDIAADYLQAKGYKIVERNWHYRHREIDIIAYAPRTGVLCFVEVKARRNDRYGVPEFAVNRKKMWFLSVAASHYVRSRNVYTDVQFDIIAITGTPKSGYRLIHIPNAIPPSARTTHRF